MAHYYRKNLTFSYETQSENIFDNVSVTLDTDWKLGFTGRNGRGKTTLLKLLMKEYAYGGSIVSPVSFAYFPYVIRDKSLDTIAIAYEIVETLELWQLERELPKLGLKEDVLYRPFNTLSNGEQTRIILALMFLMEYRFLLLDEPTNHLDAEGRRLVAQYLQKKKWFILVSHDRKFLDECVDHIMVLNPTSIEIQKGNFSSWWFNKEQQDASEKEKKEKLTGEIKRVNADTRNPLRYFLVTSQQLRCYFSGSLNSH